LISLIQRVSQARVVVDQQTIGEIGPGLLVLLCAERGDSEIQADKLLAKILKLRIFPDAPGDGPTPAGQTLAESGAAHKVAGAAGSKAGKMNRSVQDKAGGLLIVSQFTLAADVSGGNRPSFTGAASPDEGRRLYDYFVAQARLAHTPVETGAFGADMQLHLVNDGPVTIPLRVV
jgi:D-tyrosyl-tRNA(Tyr) deacylase